MDKQEETVRQVDELVALAEQLFRCSASEQDRLEAEISWWQKAAFLGWGVALVALSLLGLGLL